MDYDLNGDEFEFDEELTEKCLMALVEKNLVPTYPIFIYLGPIPGEKTISITDDEIGTIWGAVAKDLSAETLAHLEDRLFNFLTECKNKRNSS